MLFAAVNVRLTFPEYKGRKAFVMKTVNSFTVNSSWQNLTGTAQIVIAKKLFIEKLGQIKEAIQSGCPIILEGGYNGVYVEEFRGVVSQVLDDMPIMLNCEDNMYVLKRTAVNKSVPVMGLGEFLRGIVPSQFAIDAADIQLPYKSWSRMTVAQILDYMKTNYNIYSYFVGDTLVSGKVYTDNPSNEIVKYSLFGANRNIISNDLKYVRKEDIQLKIMMKHLDTDGKVVQVVVGDTQGEVQTFFTASSGIDKMKAEGLVILDKLKYDGYNGTITTFAIPFVKHGWTASVENRQYPEKSGAYYVDIVTTTLDDHGAYHRVVKIGKRAAIQ